MDNMKSDIQNEMALKDESALLITVGQVATLLGCSTRHVQRLRDSGRMPAPICLGSLTRWNKAVIDHWIAADCPDPRKHSTTKNRANPT